MSLKLYCHIVFDHDSKILFLNFEFVIVSNTGTNTHHLSERQFTAVLQMIMKSSVDRDYSTGLQENYRGSEEPKCLEK